MDLVISAVAWWMLGHAIAFGKTESGTSFNQFVGGGGYFAKTEVMSHDPTHITKGHETWREHSQIILFERPCLSREFLPCLLPSGKKTFLSFSRSAMTRATIDAAFFGTKIT